MITYRVFAQSGYAYNARIKDDLCNQRSVCETVNSVIKCLDSWAGQAREWCRQFRKITLDTTVYRPNSHHTMTPVGSTDSAT